MVINIILIVLLLLEVVVVRLIDKEGLKMKI